MKHFLTATVLAALLALLPAPARADDPGLTVLNFLKLELGAGSRAAALGEAYTAVVDDATATYWNPAGLLGIQRNDALGSHNEWIQDLRHEFVSFGAHRGRHAVGLSFLGLYTDDIEEREAETGEFLGHFGFSDNAFSLSYAFQVVPTLGVGGTFRYVWESVVGTSVDDFSMNGTAFDIGATWTTPLTGVTAAGVLRNLGGKVSYDFEGAQDFDLPTTLQGGVAYRREDLAGGALVIAADVAAARGDDATAHLGAEYAYHGQFLFDAGYRAGFDNQNVSFGVGYQKGIRAHYAFTPIYNDLGNSHRFSLGYSW
jgi:hypothetical protein